MKYIRLVKVSLCLLALGTSLRAAEFRDGKLWVEVLLASGTTLKIEPAGSARVNMLVSEEDSPIQANLSGTLQIQVRNPDPLLYWGLLEGSLPWEDQSEGVLREVFAWEDSMLVIRRETLIYAPDSFPDRDEALEFALAAGYPEESVQSIPLLNSTVMIRAQNGTEHYYETPLRLHSDSPVYIGGVKLEFKGEFILKTVNGKIVLNHFLPLEDYIAGVIQHEIGSNAPLEALKAQAVAARTHAVSLLLYNRHVSDGYDLCNTTHCQVYKGTYLQTDDVRKAVLETQSEILLTSGRVADATYHSSCGGKTDASSNIWNGLPQPYLMGVTCIASAENFDLTLEDSARRWIDTPVPTQGMSSWEKNSMFWSTRITRQALAKNLGLSYVNRIVINKRGVSGRITDMSFYGSGTVRLTSEYKIRQAFGGLRSSLFYIRQVYSADTSGNITIYPQDTLILVGKGSGHGVGMCQVGTLQRARNGSSYREILSHYYPGTWLSDNWTDYGEK